MKQQMGSIGDEHTSFRHFSKQLRLETATAAFSSLSIGDSIWSDTVLQAVGKAPVDCRNFPSTVSPELRPGDGWTTGLGAQKLAFTHSCFNRIKNNEDYSSSVGDFSHKSFGFNKSNVMLKSNYVNKSNRKSGGGKKNRESDAISGKTNSRSNGVNKSDMDSNGNVGAVDKRFKVLPPSEALPRSEAVGGYIFVCNNDTMQENLNRQLFGLPSRYRDSVRAITPGLPLFLYNYSTHQLFGIFQAASFGGANIDPLAWEDKKNPGESRFPAQVRIVRRKLYDPLEEDSFRPFLHHYDGPKFRLELSVPEALALLDIFSEQNV